MKQIDECLARAFEGKPPLTSKKWKAVILHNRVLCLFHYQHFVLGYDFITHTIQHEWHEKPADKRGLDAALQWLKERKERDY